MGTTECSWLSFLANLSLSDAQYIFCTWASFTMCLVSFLAQEGCPILWSSYYCAELGKGSLAAFLILLLPQHKIFASVKQSPLEARSPNTFSMFAYPCIILHVFRHKQESVLPHLPITFLFPPLSTSPKSLESCLLVFSYVMNWVPSKIQLFPLIYLPQSMNSILRHSQMSLSL